MILQICSDIRTEIFLFEQNLLPLEKGDYIALDKTVEALCANGWVVAESSTDK